MDQGDWIKESTNYLWDLSSAQSSDGSDGGHYCCHPLQRSPKYPDGVPAARATAGQTLRVRFWGNGHTSYSYGSPNHVDPGLVRIYCSRTPEQEIVKISELTVDKMMVESNFSADAVSQPKGGGEGGPNDKANWMFLTIPKGFPNGRHMCVWTWALIKDDFLGGWRNKYSTCFDVFVSGGSDDSGTDQSQTPPPSPQAPAPDVQAKCAETCYRGGQQQYTCQGSNCPPCRYGQNCFDYNTEGKCPAWAGGFDCLKGQAI